MLNGDKRRTVELLSTAPTFSRCNRNDLVALVLAGRETSLPSGWGFVQEGTPADACYVLLSGTARVFHGRHEIATLGPGDVIGEMAFLDGGQRDATVTSSTPVRVLRIEYDALRALLAKRTHLKDAMVAVYTARRAPSPPVERAHRNLNWPDSGSSRLFSFAEPGRIRPIRAVFYAAFSVPALAFPQCTRSGDKWVAIRGSLTMCCRGIIALVVP